MYKQYRDEADARYSSYGGVCMLREREREREWFLSPCCVRKLLISDYNDLKARQQEQQTEEETQEKEDPTILKLKLA